MPNASSLQFHKGRAHNLLCRTAHETFDILLGLRFLDTQILYPSPPATGPPILQGLLTFQRESGPDCSTPLDDPPTSIASPLPTPFYARLLDCLLACLLASRRITRPQYSLPQPLIHQRKAQSIFVISVAVHCCTTPSLVSILYHPRYRRTRRLLSAVESHPPPPNAQV